MDCFVFEYYGMMLAICIVLRIMQIVLNKYIHALQIKFLKIEGILFQ